MSMLASIIAQSRRRYDSDAAAYLTAIRSAGATVTGTQEATINAFIVAEKAASRWAGIGRIYLPVWGLAAANAICMKSLTSGTFVGGVTHGAGYVQGNGTSGYFNSDISPNDAGLTVTSGYAFAVKITSGTVNRFILSSQAGTNAVQLFGGTSVSGIIGAGAATNSSPIGNIGALIINRTGASTTILHKRLSSGFTSGSTVTTAATSIPDFVFRCMAQNNSGAASLFSDAQFSIFGIGLGMDDPSAFTLNLKTLWETVTGLSLP